MPYVDPKRRIPLRSGSIPQTAGELAYVIQQKLNDYLAENGLSYKELAECLGALEGAKIDLTDRIIRPYEEKKQRQNGEVWTVCQGTTIPSYIEGAGI